MKSVIVLRSISQCMKAVMYLEEVGRIEEVSLMYTGERCSCEEMRRTEKQMSLGHRIIHLKGNTLVCRDCGKLFHTRRQALTPQDRAVFEALDPRVPFGTQSGILIQSCTCLIV